MKQAIIAILVIAFIFACSGGSGSNSNSASRPQVSSALDLRLGQISSSSSPVAVSAALQNGESITIYANNLSNDFEAIYVSPLGNTLQAKLDASGKPYFAQYDSTTIAYTNYTKENTVDITVQSPNTSKRSRSTTFDQHLIESEVLEFLNSEQFLQIILETNENSESAIRTLLAASYAALRVSGCSSNEFAPKEFSGDLCGSILLEKIRLILKESNYNAITINLNNNYQECEIPKTYEELSACAIIIWKDLVEATKQGVLGDYPIPNESSGTGSGGGTNTGGDGASTGGEKPTPTNTPTPTVTPTATPTNTPVTPGSLRLTGKWVGTGDGNTIPTSECDKFDIGFDVSGSSDPSCISGNCSLVGTFSNAKTGDTYDLSAMISSNRTYGITSFNNNDPNKVLIVDFGTLIPQKTLINFKIKNGMTEICNGNYITYRSPMTGNWSGGSVGTTNGCGNGTFATSFNVMSNGDPSCETNDCVIIGTISGTSGFPITSTSISGTISATYDNIGNRIATLNLLSPPVPITRFTSTGNIDSNNNVDTNFQVLNTSTNCNGRANFHKN